MQTNKEDFKEHTTTAVDSMDKKHSTTTNDEECNRENADIDADQSAANMDVVNDASGGAVPTDAVDTSAGPYMLQQESQKNEILHLSFEKKDRVHKAVNHIANCAGVYFCQHWR